MIFIGVKKSGKPIRYFLAEKVELSPYSLVPEISIVTYQRSSLWTYLMDVFYLSEQRNKKEFVDITFREGNGVVSCYGVFVVGSRCLDMDDWPDCKGIIYTNGQLCSVSREKERRIIKKVFLKAKKEFRQERLNAF